MQAAGYRVRHAWEEQERTTARPVIITCVSVLVVILCACGIREPSPEPDRVVGVLLKCGAAPTELTGDECNKRKTTGELYYVNTRLVVTVRMSGRTAYVVEVPPDTAVRLGDPWPPPTR